MGIGEKMSWAALPVRAAAAALSSSVGNMGGMLAQEVAQLYSIIYQQISNFGGQLHVLTIVLVVHGRVVPDLDVSYFILGSIYAEIVSPLHPFSSPQPLRL